MAGAHLHVYLGHIKEEVSNVLVTKTPFTIQQHHDCATCHDERTHTHLSKPVKILH